MKMKRTKKALHEARVKNRLRLKIRDLFATDWLIETGHGGRLYRFYVEIHATSK